jgi:hypothetical protein
VRVGVESSELLAGERVVAAGLSLTGDAAVKTVGCDVLLSRGGTHQQLAWRDEAIRAVEFGERLSNLLPGGFATGLVEARQHLVQCAVGFLLQP